MILETSVDKKGEGVLEVKCKIGSSYINNIMNEITAEVQANSELKGFRKGKAPLNMIKKIYEGKIKYDTLNKILPEVYEKIIKEQNIKPVTMPEFAGYENIKSDTDLELSFVVETMPEIVSMAEFEGLEVPKVKLEYDEKKVLEDEIKILQSSFASYGEIEGEVAQDDFIKVNYSYKGENDEEVSKNRFFIVKEGDPHYALSSKFIGKKLKEEGSVMVQFPEDFAEKELAGKKKKIKFTIEEGKRMVMPALDDELAKKFNLGSYKEFEEKVQKNIDFKMSEQEKLSKADKIYDKIIEKSEFSISPSIILQQAQAELSKKVNQLMMQGKKMDDYFKEENITQEQLIENVKNETVFNVKKYLVMEKIAKDANIDISDDAFYSFLKEIKDLELLNQDKIEEYYKKNKEAKENLISRIKFLKVAEYLETKVKFKGTEKKKLGE